MATKTKSKPRSKPGDHGTLYLYSIEYNDGPDGDPAFPIGERTSLWAYSMEHALERFDESDEGFTAIKIARKLEDCGPSRWTWHTVGASNP